MCNESKKTRLIRGEQFFQTYLSGRVIDIGCGEDLVVPHAEPFDVQHGDAQHIALVREPCTYDAVHSSHCLEHMADVPGALLQWWSLVKPGGHLITVVPDENLYEQGIWPSIFNLDHKATFRLEGHQSWSPVSYNLVNLITSLPDAEIISVELHDLGYEYKLQRSGVSFFGAFLFKAKILFVETLSSLKISNSKIFTLLDRGLFPIGVPIDQTRSHASAQIQVIARKLTSKM